MRNAVYFTIVMIILATALLSGCSQQKQEANMESKPAQLIDKLENAEKYYDLHPGFQKAFEFLRQENLAEMEAKRYELDGDKLVATIDKAQGRSKDSAYLEAHRQFIDIQYCIKGPETFGWKPTDTCTDVREEYKPDIMFFNDTPDAYNTLTAGQFTIFFPNDAHSPLISDGDLHKVVIKVAVDY